MLDYIRGRIKEMREAAESNLLSEFQEVVFNRASGFNDVEAWTTPNGELVLLLSHRNTSDADCLVRVRVPADVILIDRREGWEEDEQLKRINTGGNWNA